MSSSPPPMPAVATPLATPVGPLDERDYETLRQARLRRAIINRAASVATFNGWSMGVLAAVSLPFVLYSPSSLAVCLGLAAVAYVEFKGRGMLRRLDPHGPRLLGMNQLALGALIVIYCLWSLHTATTAPPPYREYLQADPSLGESLGSIDDLYRSIATAAYAAMIGLTVLYQGAMAYYYFSRTPHLRTYLAQTPAWVTQMDRAMG